MTDILGLDLSLTATGMSCSCGETVIKSKATGMARLSEIQNRLVVHWITEHLDWPRLFLLEGYSFGSRNSQSHALGELGGVIRLAIYERNCLWIDVPPSSIKKFATNKGNANKDEMIATAVRLGCEANDNNAVDAWWLRQLGLYLFCGERCVIPHTAYREEIATKIRGTDMRIEALLAMKAREET